MFHDGVIFQCAFTILIACTHPHIPSHIPKQIINLSPKRKVASMFHDGVIRRRTIKILIVLTNLPQNFIVTHSECALPTGTRASYGACSSTADGRRASWTFRARGARDLWSLILRNNKVDFLSFIIRNIIVDLWSSDTARFIFDLPNGKVDLSEWQIWSLISCTFQRSAPPLSRSQPSSAATFLLIIELFIQLCCYRSISQDVVVNYAFQFAFFPIFAFFFFCFFLTTSARPDESATINDLIFLYFF